MEGNKPYYLNSNGTLHIRGVCKNSKGYPNSDDSYFETENQVYANVGMHFKWCKECAEWREDLVKDALKQKEETK